MKLSINEDELPKDPFAIWWIRRDIRLEDNRALFECLSSGLPVVPLFIFDKHILDHLPKKDMRVLFIHQELTRLQERVKEMGKNIVFAYGRPEEVWEQLLKTNFRALYVNKDYEPYGLSRDEKVRNLVNKASKQSFWFKDQVIFEEDEVLSGTKSVYTVFTPFSKVWKKKLALDEDCLKNYPSENKLVNLANLPNNRIISLEEMGFEKPESFSFPERTVHDELISHYGETRNFPAQKGTSRLSVHLRFGTISIRALAKQSLNKPETFLNELIWRDFYQMILFHFPHTVEKSFKPIYDQVVWSTSSEDFEKWCEGKTGYPLVDAGMRELNETGYMHNRVRMVVASFLTKHLLIDWRLGERYFAEKLLDFDLAANIGGWQWAASTGTDAQPYFRIFNPQSQAEKFDPKNEYIKKWVPEYGTKDYPLPMVDHSFARARALAAFKTVLNRGVSETGS